MNACMNLLRGDIAGKKNGKGKLRGEREKIVCEKGYGFHL